jgi:hypothetical protein
LVVELVVVFLEVAVVELEDIDFLLEQQQGVILQGLLLWVQPL